MKNKDIKFAQFHIFFQRKKKKLKGRKEFLTELENTDNRGIFKMVSFYKVVLRFLRARRSEIFTMFSFIYRDSLRNATQFVWLR